VTAPEPKPPAALSPTLIRRGEGHAVPAAAVPPAEAASLRMGGRGVPELGVPERPVGHELAPLGDAAAKPRGPSRLMSWRGASLFGVMYLAALMLFAAAFDMWPTK
jgi:hypothetical protein